VGPLENQPLMIRFIGDFFFSAKFWPSFVFLEGKQELTYIEVWNCWNLINYLVLKE
jgi:hypothetical protein